jgi:hypothetical protein
MMSEHQFPEARDLGQAILLLQVLGRDVQALTGEIRILRNDMATREELYQVRDDMKRDMDSLRKEVHENANSSTFDRITSVAQKLLILATLAGLFWAVVSWSVRVADSLPK